MLLNTYSISSSGAWESILQLAERQNYDNNRSSLLKLIEHKIERKAQLIAAQDKEPTAERNKALNFLEREITVLIGTVSAFDALLKQHEELTLKALEQADKNELQLKRSFALWHESENTYRQLSDLYLQVFDAAQSFKNQLTPANNDTNN